MNKKGQEFRMILFISVFIGTMTIISSIFIKPAITKEITILETDWKWLYLGLNELPILGTFTNFLVTSIHFFYIHPYLTTFLTAMITVPLAYLILRLVRGGG